MRAARHLAPFFLCAPPKRCWRARERDPLEYLLCPDGLSDPTRIEYLDGLTFQTRFECGSRGALGNSEGFLPSPLSLFPYFLPCLFSSTGCTCTRGGGALVTRTRTCNFVQTMTERFFLNGGSLQTVIIHFGRAISTGIILPLIAWVTVENYDGTDGRRFVFNSPTKEPTGCLEKSKQACCSIPDP